MSSIAFLSGVFMATFAASGLVFLKFYRASKDPFFLYFCLSCWMIAIERIVLLSIDGSFTAGSADKIESLAPIYLIRLVAFLLILVAVIQKNRQKI